MHGVWHGCIVHLAHRRLRHQRADANRRRYGCVVNQLDELVLRWLVWDDLAERIQLLLGIGDSLDQVSTLALQRPATEILSVQRCPLALEPLNLLAERHHHLVIDGSSQKHRQESQHDPLLLRSKIAERF